MKNQLRFSVAYWHTMRGTRRATPSGPARCSAPGKAGDDSVDNAMQSRPRGL